MEKKMATTILGLGFRVLLKYIEYGVYGDLVRMYPQPYSI